MPNPLWDFTVQIETHHMVEFFLRSFFDSLTRLSNRISFSFINASVCVRVFLISSVKRQRLSVVPETSFPDHQSRFCYGICNRCTELSGRKRTFSPHVQTTYPVKRCTAFFAGFLFRSCSSKIALQSCHNSFERIGGTGRLIHSCSGLSFHFRFTPKLFV